MGCEGGLAAQGVWPGRTRRCEGKGGQSAGWAAWSEDVLAMRSSRTICTRPPAAATWRWRRGSRRTRAEGGAGIAEIVVGRHRRFGGRVTWATHGEVGPDICGPATAAAEAPREPCCHHRHHRCHHRCHAAASHPRWRRRRRRRKWRRGQLNHSRRHDDGDGDADGDADGEGEGDGDGGAASSGPMGAGGRRRRRRLECAEHAGAASAHEGEAADGAEARGDEDDLPNKAGEGRAPVATIMLPAEKPLWALGARRAPGRRRSARGSAAICTGSRGRPAAAWRPTSHERTEEDLTEW